MINAFIAQFTGEKIAWEKKGTRYFFIQKGLHAHLYLKPYSAGLPLGEEKAGTFYPSLPLLQWIAARSARKAKITDRAAWLFLCGRNIPADAIITKSGNGIVLVQNKEDENLGYGMVTGKGIQNIKDRGDYLRRERKSSRA